MGTTKVNRTRLDALLRTVQAAQGVAVDFGILESAPHRGPNGEPGPTLAQVLAWVEAGGGPNDLPARPILRWVMEAKRQEIRRHLRWIAHRIAIGQDPAGELEALRRDLEQWARERMEAVGAVDSGQTRDAITALVRRVGERR